MIGTRPAVEVLSHLDDVLAMVNRPGSASPAASGSASTIKLKVPSAMLWLPSCARLM
jgi:hypothetical protein